MVSFNEDIKVHLYFECSSWSKAHDLWMPSWHNIFLLSQNLLGCTLPETNITPENRPLEEEIPIGNRYVSFREGTCQYMYVLFS